MRRAGGFSVVLLALTGCGDHSTAAPPMSALQPPAPSQFDPASTGTIAGQVRWAGERPVVPPISVERFQRDGNTIEHVQRPNPFAPQIDGEGRLIGAVMLLRGVDPSQARPWDHPPVTIEMHDDRPMVRQGESAPGPVGFVRRGNLVTFVSRQDRLHAVRARGDAFFTLTLPDPDKPRKRALPENGIVKLTSGNGQAAMHGYLLVDEHPYYALTDADGRFRLAQVPPGQYQLVCWRPDWRIDRREHDPETQLHVRLFFKPPMETVVPITVKTGEVAAVMLEVGS